MDHPVHPLTGEVMPDDLAALEAAEARVDKFLRDLWIHYRFRDQLRLRIAELRGRAELPRPRYRSTLQQKVAECPRCGERHA